MASMTSVELELFVDDMVVVEERKSTSGPHSELRDF